MSFFRSTAVAAFALSSIATCTSPQTQPVVPGAYIVEFMDDIADAPSFYTNLSDNRITASPRITLSHQLFNGASFNLEGSDDIDATVQTIQEMGMVNKIWPVRLYSNPATLLATIDKISPFDTSTLRKRDDEVDTYSPHVMGGVDKLHDAGFTGEELFIGVVDTGVDYNHPALGGGFGPGFKVVTGYDLVGDDYTGFNTPVPDPDPIDCGGHGTHVSGIIAADFNEYNFTGVAPNSSLGVWKVFGCEGQVGNDVLIAAFNMAYEAGVDLISASIGGESGWTEDPWDVAVQRITEKGVPCIIAAGNDGANGLFDTSTASESIGAMSVGSIDNINQPAILIGATVLEDGANATQFWYAKGNFGDFGTITAPLYVITLDTTITADACSALPDSTPDLSGYVVLIRRGTCTFDTKIANAAAFGAERFLFYNNVAGVPTSPGDSSTTIPVGMVSAAKGAEFVAAVAAGAQISVEFTALEEALLQFTNNANELTGGKISTFTPGGLILSTYPLSKGGYAVESGTSMATPYISGVVSLIKQIRGKNALTPDGITSLLASTADPVNFNDGVTTYGFLAPVVQQGGGLVNAFEAAYTNTFLDLDNVALNDTDFFEPANQVKISNTGSTAQTYTFENVIAATAFTLDTGIFPVSFPPGLDSTDAAGATIRFEPSSLTVEPKSSGVLTMHFTLPEGLDATRIPVYSGFVFINGTSDALSLPYAGIASSLKDAAIMDFPDGFSYVASSADLSTPLTNGTQTFLLAGNSTNSTFPTIVYALAMGSRILRVDVVPEDVYGLPRVIGQQILGSISSYPAENVPRNLLFSASWDGSLADGSVAPAGKYKFLVRALKTFGNATYDQDYESFSTVYFDIKYAE